MDSLALEHTYLGLIAWKHKMFEKAGKVLVMYDAGDMEALDEYIRKMDKLEAAMTAKIAEVDSVDKSRDLQISLAKVIVLNNHMKNHRARDEVTDRVLDRSMNRTRSVGNRSAGGRSPGSVRRSPSAYNSLNL